MAIASEIPSYNHGLQNGETLEQRRRLRIGKQRLMIERAQCIPDSSDDRSSQQCESFVKDC